MKNQLKTPATMCELTTSPTGGQAWEKSLSRNVMWVAKFWLEDRSLKTEDNPELRTRNLAPSIVDIL